MPFPEKLITIMRKLQISAKYIKEMSFGEISISDVRSFQNGNKSPSKTQINHLNKLLGIDCELFLDTPKSNLPPVQKKVTIKEFSLTEKLEKPGKIKKPSKIKNSITRIHKIPKPDPDKMICSHCFQLSETCRYNHPEDSEIKTMLGGPGISEKNPDELCALLCAKCTPILDMKPDKNASRLVKLEHAMLWAKAIVFSQAIRIAELE